MNLRIHSIIGLLMATGAGCAFSHGEDTTDPSGEERTGVAFERWEGEDPSDDKQSTHLWIVKRAVKILESRPDSSEEKRLATLMDDSTCRSRWQQGLIDADFKKEYTGGTFDLEYNASEADIILSMGTWEKHFYDPDTGLNYRGNADTTARTEAHAHASAAADMLSVGDYGNGCYELGLALHFMTDLTQPMHAANFSALDVPPKLHSEFEKFVMDYAQSSVGDVDPQSMEFPGGPPDEILVSTARAAKSRWPELKFFLNDPLWKVLPGVNGQVDHLLKEAQRSTARYLYAMSRQLYNPLRLQWKYDGAIPGKHCVLIDEPSDLHTIATFSLYRAWSDNYLCSDDDLGLEWKYKDPPAGKCTQISDPADPSYWNDNYLCLPSTSPIQLYWSTSGRIPGKSCVQVIEPSEQYGWRNDYLCYDVSWPSCGVLRPGRELRAGDSVSSCDGQITLTMQTDGNLVLYENGVALWSSGTAGTGGSNVAIFQGDGNLVVYGNNGPVWWTGTQFTGGRIIIQNDGNLVVLDARGAVRWASNTWGHHCGSLLPEETLHAGESKSSCDGRFSLTMQTDGNLVLYQNGAGALWSSGTVGTSGNVAIFQGDGNLVIYGTNGPVWSAGLQTSAGRLAIQDDGNLVIYDTNSVARWASNTCCH